MLHAVLIAYLVIALVYVVVDVLTEGLGKSTVGPIGGLIIGVIVSFRIWGARARGPTA